jgi:hypothetical protein
MTAQAEEFDEPSTITSKGLCDRFGRLVGMTTGLTVWKHDIGEGHVVFTRSDGEVFHLMWHESGQASLFHNDTTPSNGIGLDLNVMDKFSRAEQLILAYPADWL